MHQAAGSGDGRASILKEQIKCAIDIVHKLNAVTRQLMAEEARVREALARAHDILRCNPSPDTFLGRQHYPLIPLPDQQE